MKISKLGIKTARIKELDDNFPAQDILLQSGQLLQYSSGIYGYNNVPLKVKQQIEQIVREELERAECVEAELPTLQPKEIWEKSGRWEKYTENGTMMTVRTEKGEYGLAPTAEEAIVEFAREQINSHKKIPVTYYQIGEKYRNELRNRGCLLRGKSFLMMDAYSFNKGKEDLQETYQNMKQAYFKIFERLGLEVIPVVAQSGDIGGDKSEEFMVLADIGEDTILVDEEHKKGFNVEILERPGYEEYLKDECGIENPESLQSKKAIELGHIFQLDKKYSQTMDANYINSENKPVPYYMGCYGIGVSRTLATIYEKSLVRDEKGNPAISLPVGLAPYLLHIVASGEEREKTAECMYEVLKNHGIDTILDDRKKESMGTKMGDWKVLGTPYVGILGNRVNKDEIEVQNLGTGEKMTLKIVELMKSLKKLEKDRKKNPNAKLSDYTAQEQQKFNRTEMADISKTEDGKNVEKPDGNEEKTIRIPVQSETEEFSL